MLGETLRKYNPAKKLALQVAADPAKRHAIMRNGMRFVRREHSWEAIIRRYEAPIRHAVLKARLRQDKPPLMGW